MPGHLSLPVVETPGPRVLVEVPTVSVNAEAGFPKRACPAGVHFPSGYPPSRSRCIPRRYTVLAPCWRVPTYPPAPKQSVPWGAVK